MEKFLNFIGTILNWLDGKKSTILSILMLVVGYLLSTGVITSDLASLLLGICGFLGGGAVGTTSLMKDRLQGLKR